MTALKESDAPSIVLIGQFSPTAFQPAWMVSKELLKPAEGEGAKVEIVSQQITDFTLPWLHVQVTGDRCVLRALDSSSDNHLLDLAIGVCASIVSGPIKMMGLNREMRYRLDSVAGWHALGDRLAPKGPWGDTGLVGWPALGRSQPGLRTLVMEGRREDSKCRFLRVTVGVPEAGPERQFIISSNEHYDAEFDGLTRLESEKLDLASVLSESWLASQTFAKSLAERLLV